MRGRLPVIALAAIAVAIAFFTSRDGGGTAPTRR